MSDEKEGATLDEFLKDINIDDKAVQILKKRNVSIEELMELDDDDLKSFLGEEVKLDALSKNRFIKSITKLKQKQISSNVDNISKNYNISSSLDTTIQKKQHIVVSPAEHNAIMTLYGQYDKASSLSGKIQISIETLNEWENTINIEIENCIDSIINNIKNKRNNLLNDIDNMLNYKTNLLQQQLNTITNYLDVVNDGKLKYEQYINKQNMDIIQRKELILKMINDIMNKDGVAITMLTAPKMQFKFDHFNKKLNKLYETMEINDCDQPKKMILTLKKVYDDMISVNYALNEYDINGPKKILEIILEYAILPKSFSKKKKKKKSKKSKKKKTRKKKQNMDSDDDDSSSDDESKSSESDSSLDSSSESISNSDDDQYEYDIDRKLDDDIIDSLKWKQNASKIKYKKNSSKNKYKISDLKEGRAYLIRIRARNSSGFGPYSDILSAVTKEAKIKFDRYNKQYVNVEKKGKRVRILGGSGSGCIYTMIQSSKGFRSGIKKWKIKIDPMLSFDQDMEQIGVCSQLFDGTQLTNKQITNCGHGIGSGTGLRPGDLIEIILNFNEMKVIIKKNNMQCKQQQLIKGNKYYPVIQCCVCRAQSYQLIK